MMTDQPDIQVKRVHTTIAGGEEVGGVQTIAHWGVMVDDQIVAEFQSSNEGELEAYRHAEKLRQEHDDLDLTDAERKKFERWMLDHIRECLHTGNPHMLLGFIYNVIHKIKGDDLIFYFNPQQTDELCNWGLRDLIP